MLGRLRSALIIACLFALVIFAYLGQYSRYIADDYCTANAALTLGIPQSINNWYYNYAGQYTNFLLKGWVAYAGPGFAGLLPALILLAWSGAAIWTAYQLLSLTSIKDKKWLAVLFGLLFVFAVFAGIPSLIQSLYWIGASIPYTLPQIVMTFFIGWVIQVSRRHPGMRPSLVKLILTGLVMGVVAGLSEVSTVFQITVYGLMGLAVLRFAPVTYRRPALWLLGVAVVCLLIGLVIVVTAPGNAVRQALFPDRLSIPEVIVRTLIVSASYIATAIGIFSPAPYLVVIIISVVFFYQLRGVVPELRLSSRQARQIQILTLVATYALILVAIGPPVYATSVAPPARVYLMPHLAILTCVFICGITIGLSARRNTSPPAGSSRLTLVLVSAMILLGPIAYGVRMLSSLPFYQNYAQQWDNNDAQIRDAAERGETSVSVPMLVDDLAAYEHLDVISEDPRNFVNSCAAAYYGLETIIGVPQVE